MAHKQEIIVSLTTFPKRVNAAAKVIDNILHKQTQRPDKVILNLSDDEFVGRKLPKELKKLEEKGLIIYWVEKNLKPSNKWYYTMRNNPDSLVIVLDDDNYYPVTLIENLVKTHKKFPDSIVAGRVHKMRFSQKGILLPYKQWDLEFNWLENSSISKIQPSHALFGTGVGGMLLPVKLFDDETYNMENIIKYTLHQDDVWIKAMALRNGITVVAADTQKGLQYIDDTQSVGLYNTINQAGPGNDKPIKDVFEHYAISRDIQGIGVNSVEVTPKVSVVIPTYNASKFIINTLDNVMKQTLKNFECIIIDDGSTDDTTDVIKNKIANDDRFILFNQKNQGVSVARNKGLARATGDYIIFLDADDIYDTELLKELYDAVVSSQLDVAICGYNVLDNTDESIGYNIKNSLTDTIPKGVFSSKDIDFIFNFGVLTVWNKMFRRNFIINNNLTFNKNIRRSQDLLFVGSALVIAERIVYIDKSLLTYRSQNENSNMGRAFKYPTSFIDSLDLLWDFLGKKKLQHKFAKSYNNLLVGSCLSYLEIYEHDNILLNKVFAEVSRRFNEKKLSKKNKHYLFMPDKHETVLAVCSGGAEQYLQSRLKWQKDYSLSLTRRLNATETRRVEEKEYYINELESVRTELMRLQQDYKDKDNPGIKTSLRLLSLSIKNKVVKKGESQ